MGGQETQGGGQIKQRSRAARGNMGGGRGWSVVGGGGSGSGSSTAWQKKRGGGGGHGGGALVAGGGGPYTGFSVAVAVDPKRPVEST